MRDYANGLPGALPPGEAILWQGSPDWRALARDAFHVRGVAVYFALLAVIAFASGAPTGAAMTVVAGIAGAALLHALAWATARATIYTLTDKRVVFRIGVALPKCINLPLGVISAVDANVRSDGTGDLPLHVEGAQRIGYAGLWPHARPWRLATPQPMLRAVPDAARVGALIARTCLAAQPEGRIAPMETPAVAQPVLEGALAA